MKLVQQTESPLHCWKHGKYHQIESKNREFVFMNLCNNGLSLFSRIKKVWELLLFRIGGEYAVKKVAIESFD
jgi:hypothetical protein